MTLDSKRAGALSRRRLLLGSGVTAMVAATGVMTSKSFAATTAYKYDELGRLILVNHADGTKTGYAYDAADNRTQAAVNAGVSPPTVIQVTAASNLRTLANNAGYAGGPGANYQFVVGSGVTVIGSAGGTGIDTGTWPSDAVLALIVNGNIYGGGGKGGKGGWTNSAATAGTAGGNAVYAQAPITITINSGGSVKSGGGGGGGGSYAGQSTPGGFAGSGGGGGGGGFPNGSGGAGAVGTPTSGASGSTGTTAGGGAAGGYPLGGAGGGAGSAGAAGATVNSTPGAGGAAGYAVRKNGQTVTVTNNGTVNGTIG